MSATIDAPPDRVFAAMTDVDHVGEWMPNFVRIERLTPGPLAKGSVFRETRKMFGREATEQFEVTEIDPVARVFALYVDGTKGSSKCGWFKFRQTVEPADAGSRTTISCEIGGATGCMALLGKLMMGAMRKALAKDMAALKAWIESGAPTS